MTAIDFKPIFEAYKAAVLAKDVDAFMALYDDNVWIFDTWGVWSYEGASAWRGAVAGWLGSLGAERVAVEFDDVQIAAANDIAVAHAIVTYGSRSETGETSRSMQNRLTWVAMLKNGAWKIVHEHTSAPADFTTAKIMLQR